MWMYRSLSAKGKNFLNRTEWTSTLERNHQMKSPVAEPALKSCEDNRVPFAANEDIKSTGGFRIVQFE
jgi:hypothetical protein